MALYQKTYGLILINFELLLSVYRLEQFESLLKCDIIDMKKLKILAFNGNYFRQENT